jgi:hypothetical protein
VVGYYTFFLEFEVGDWVQYEIDGALRWGEITEFRITYRERAPEGESEYLVNGVWLTLDKIFFHRPAREMQPA